MSRRSRIEQLVRVHFLRSTPPRGAADRLEIPPPAGVGLPMCRRAQGEIRRRHDTDANLVPPVLRVLRTEVRRSQPYGAYSQDPTPVDAPLGFRRTEGGRGRSLDRPVARPTPEWGRVPDSTRRRCETPIAAAPTVRPSRRRSQIQSDPKDRPNFRRVSAANWMTDHRPEGSETIRRFSGGERPSASTYRQISSAWAEFKSIIKQQ